MNPAIRPEISRESVSDMNVRENLIGIGTSKERTGIGIENHASCRRPIPERNSVE